MVRITSLLYYSNNCSCDSHRGVYYSVVNQYLLSQTRMQYYKGNKFRVAFTINPKLVSDVGFDISVEDIRYTFTADYSVCFHEFCDIDDILIHNFEVEFIDSKTYESLKLEDGYPDAYCSDDEVIALVEFDLKVPPPTNKVKVPITLNSGMRGGRFKSSYEERSLNKPLVNLYDNSVILSNFPREVDITEENYVEMTPLYAKRYFISESGLDEMTSLSAKLLCANPEIVETITYKCVKGATPRTELLVSTIKRLLGDRRFTSLKCITTNVSGFAGYFTKELGIEYIDRLRVDISEDVIDNLSVGTLDTINYEHASVKNAKNYLTSYTRMINSLPNVENFILKIENSCCNLDVEFVTGYAYIGSVKERNRLTVMLPVVLDDKNRKLENRTELEFNVRFDVELAMQSRYKRATSAN